MNAFSPDYVPLIQPDTTNGKKARAATRGLEKRKDGYCGQLRAKTPEEQGRDRAKRMANI